MYQNITLDDTELLQNKSLWSIKVEKWYKTFCISTWLFFFKSFKLEVLVLLTVPVPVQICRLSRRPQLSPLVDIFTPPEFLQNPCPELGPVLIVELLEVQGQMELRRVAPQERIVLLLFPDGGGVLCVRGRKGERVRKWTGLT